MRDLVWMPVEEYRKDGHLVKGIQKGAGSFGVSTSSAVIDLAQRLVGAVQVKSVGLHPGASCRFRGDLDAGAS